MDAVKAKLSEWYGQPFRSDMDALGWFAFIGLLIAISVLWHIVLGHIAKS
jgi:hypothetical protein